MTLARLGILDDQTIVNGRVVNCRCGHTHAMRERAVRCVYCGSPTVDFHLVCPRPGCRNAEALERQAEHVLAVVAEHQA